MEPFQNYLQPLIQFLHNHPNYAGLVTFFVVFCEAMAVIGVIVPGTVTMTALGILMGTNVIPLTTNLIWAIFGAILGDYLSYVIGIYYKNRLHKIWPFKKHPALLTKGEKFFKTHGGKSIFIGRFVGPMRAMIPMVAGMLNMPQKQFLIAAIPSASLWAVGYIMPGVLLGTLTLQLPPKLATEFLLVIILFVISVWAVIWLIRHFFKTIARYIDKQTKKLWSILTNHISLNWIPKFLSAQHRSDNHKQLTMLIFALILGACFVLLSFNVIKQGILTNLDKPLYYFLQSVRTPITDKIMLIITFIGEPKALILAFSIFIMWLALKRHWHMFIHAGAMLILSSGILNLIKIYTHIPRPYGIINFIHDYSFPSGHVSASITIYGFLALIVADQLRSKLRWIPYATVAALTFFVAISRLFLGFHWLTDVTGGITFGLTLLLAISISYHRKHAHKTPPLKTAVIAIATFGFIISFYGNYIFKDHIAAFWPVTKPVKMIEFKKWLNQIHNTKTMEIPVYRLNRFGHPTKSFNLQWAGKLSEIEEKLKTKGWQTYPLAKDTKDFLLRITMRATSKRKLPIISQLYDNKAETLIMTKTETKKEDGSKILVLRLWDANIETKNPNYPLWIGVIDHLSFTEKNSVLQNIKQNNKASYKQKSFNGSTQELLPYLENFKWQKIYYLPEKQPNEIRNHNWNGNVLLVYPANTK